MRLETKRAVDYYVGRPLLAAMEVAALALGVILKRDHTVGPVRSILIVKFQGIGSLVLCKPALAQLRRSHPHAKILFWGTPSVRAVAEQMAEFDEILVLDDRSLVGAVRSVLTTLIKLWRERIDWAFDLEVYSRLSSVLVTLTCARNRSGFALDQLRSRRVHTHLIYFNRYKHLTEAYDRILGQLQTTGWVVDDAEYGSWKFDLSPLPTLKRPYLVFNIHAGELALERRWPRESFQQLIDELLRRQPEATAVLIGHGASEVAYTAPLATGDRIVDLSGKLTLADTFRVIANAELMVSNDSAPLHFALSTGVKLVGLFGPTRGETYFPSNRAHISQLHVPLYCSPCVHHWEPLPCNGDNQCMKRLTVAEVLARCCALLGLPQPLYAEVTADTRSTYYPGLVYKAGLAYKRKDA